MRAGRSGRAAHWLRNWFRTSAPVLPELFMWWSSNSMTGQCGRNWAVPTTSPTTIAAVRTTPGPGRGNMAVTQHYVNAAVANRAIDSAVVHLAGAETISGAKQFAVAP